MVRETLVATSPEPTGVSKHIAGALGVCDGAVTYDGELSGNCSGYLFTVRVADGSTITPRLLHALHLCLGKNGYTSRALFRSKQLQVQVFEKHYKYAWVALALALTAAVAYHLPDVHKKPFERVVEQWVDPTWRWLVFYVQELRIPHSADEWRNIG